MSTVLVLFITYGRLVESLGGSTAVQVVAAVSYIAVLALACRFAVRNRGRLEKPTAILNVVALTLVALTAFNIFFNAAEKEPAPVVRKTEVAAAISSKGDSRPSSLNLEYINHLSEDVGRDSHRAGVPNAMIEDNGLARFLKSRGYSFIFFGSNWSGTKANRNADVSVTEGGWLNGEFMVALLKTTAMRGLVEKEEGFQPATDSSTLSPAGDSMLHCR